MQRKEKWKGRCRELQAKLAAANAEGQQAEAALHAKLAAAERMSAEQAGTVRALQQRVEDLAAAGSQLEVALQKGIALLGSRSGFLTLTHAGHIVPLLLERCTDGMPSAIYYLNFIGHHLVHAGEGTSSMDGFAVKIQASSGCSLLQRAAAVLESFCVRRYDKVEPNRQRCVAQLDVFVVQPGSATLRRATTMLLHSDAAHAVKLLCHATLLHSNTPPSHPLVQFPLLPILHAWRCCPSPTLWPCRRTLAPSSHLLCRHRRRLHGTAPIRQRARRTPARFRCTIDLLCWM